MLGAFTSLPLFRFRERGQIVIHAHGVRVQSVDCDQLGEKYRHAKKKDLFLAIIRPKKIDLVFLEFDFVSLLVVDR